MRYRLQHLVEYGLLRVVAGLAKLLPYTAALCLAWLIAWIMFNVVRFRRTEAVRRINQVFNHSLSPAQVRSIAWLSIRNLVFNAVEIMRAGTIDQQWLAKHLPGIEVEIVRVKELMSEYGSAIIAVPHMGNWDLAGWACCIYGIGIFSIAGKQKNPLVNRWLNSQRESRMRILERNSGTLRQIVKLLKQRNGSALAILPDVRMPTPDLELEFLGHTANFGRGMALFALNAAVPIVPAILRRQGWRTHTFQVFPAIIPNPQAERQQEIERITKEVINTVDQAISETPEQWFWYNKRWVLTPVDPPNPDSAKQVS